MQNLIEELGAEDKDNYVYFDSEGHAGAMIEFTVAWNGLPNKKIMITIDKA
jgi:hypothetical protein